MRQVYPAPNIVIGVGRFGLAVLERLGDDWMGLEMSGADASIKNLRLVAIRAVLAAAEPVPAAASAGAVESAPGDGDGGGWRTAEGPGAQVARHLGDGDLPTRALDFAVLRSLGLVRYRDGTYQVGVPRDDGVVEVEEEGTGGTGGGHQVVRRRRFFRWTDLSPDPIVAAEKLRLVTERDRGVDLFLAPLLHRIRRGLSPRILLATIGRWVALSEGRDPSPWPWLRRMPGGKEVAEEGLLLLGLTRQRVEEACCSDPDARRQRALREAVRRADRHFHQRLEPPLLRGRDRWSRWRDWSEGKRGAGPLELVIPRFFVPREGDPEAPLDAMEFLAQDWQAAGWARDQRHRDDRIFLALETTPFRLGLFDHDGRSARSRSGVDLDQRLKLLGDHVHQGLLRLWVDLQRVRAAEGEPGTVRERDSLASTLQQSLELLGELVVRPIATRRGGEGSPRPGSRVERELPHEPSHFLSSLVVEERADDDPVHHLLLSRLLELGLAEPEELKRFRHPLLAEVELTPEDIEHRPEPEVTGRIASGAGKERSVGRTEPVAGGGEAEDGGAEDRGPVTGLQGLRRRLNEQVRQLFDFQLLAGYRKRPTRQPPRLSIFVVGDMSEPFTRASLRPILREIHAEVLRAFTPIFQSFREGFDRSLCVTPILWMPHPADPFKGEPAACARCEEAAIIDTVHGIRHWVECVLPPGRRFIPQIFINSRVTDMSTLTLRDALRETRDFLTFQMRSDLAADPWLRRTSAGSGQSDLFASFSCYEIDFPALRCREYVANRLGRELLEELQASKARAGKGRELPKAETSFGPPAIDDLVRAARATVLQETEAAAKEEKQFVRSRLTIAETTRAAEIIGRFDEAFRTEIQTRVLGHWDRLTGTLGQVDTAVDGLRIQVAKGPKVGLQQRMQELRRLADRTIEEQALEGGLSRALGALHHLRREAGDLFRKREEERRKREDLAIRHLIPSFGGLESAREQVVQAGRAKPDGDPLRLGYLLSGLLALALGAPVSQAVAYLLDLHLHGGLAEALLGPLGYLTGGLFLFLPAWGLLRWHLRRRTRQVQKAVDHLSEQAARLLRGTGAALAHEPPSSVRSFLESCLELTAAVAGRGFALRILERTVADAHLGDRLMRSVGVQLHRLIRRAEDLGVRTTLEATTDDEDLTYLLQGHGARRAERLITAGSLHRYYRRYVRDDDHLRAALPDFLGAAGGIEHWRRQACLADTERILGHGRECFASLAEELVSDQHFFNTEVGQRLLEFVARCYSNIGFGAEFRGYEGLDPDGVQVIADATLVVHPELAPVYRQARDRETEEVREARGADERRRERIRTTKTMDLQEAHIRPNAVYMLSLVQGIRVHSVRNLRRFESFHDRIQMPDDRAFPLTPETPKDRGNLPLNSLTAFREPARRWAASRPASNGGGDRKQR